MASMHYIRYDVLYTYVLARVQYWSQQAQQDGDKLLQRLLNASDKERNTAKKKQTAELKKATKRKAEVDNLFAKCMRTGLLDALQSTISICCPKSIRQNSVNWTPTRRATPNNRFFHSTQRRLRGVFLYSILWFNNYACPTCQGLPY